MTITPQIITEHGLTSEEYARIKTHMGREPNLLELGIFSVMWSEHCSYKSSRRHLAKLPTKAPHVICGPGENAGVIDIGDNQAIIFKMESHNHPSFIEPYQGAATGVGGIMRDVFTMGARPIANMNALRFGNASHPKTAHLLSGVVAGIGGYGNCMGVPTVGGETNFDQGYNGNILVNAMCVGLAEQDKIFYSAAKGAGNPVIYVGAKTGRDGIHGATMASAEFDDASEEKRPTVQVGDPFTEKRLLEACLELMAEDAIIAIQDMGASGLTSSSVEMAAKGAEHGGGGFDMDLDKVPQREDNMSAYEMMLSESQERMLMVLKPQAEEKAKAIFRKWGLDFSVIGTTTDTGRLIIRHKGEIVADMPVPPLADDAPNLDRPYEPKIAAKALEDPKQIFVNGTFILTLDQSAADKNALCETVARESLPEGKAEMVAITPYFGSGVIYVRLRPGVDETALHPLLTALDNLKKTQTIDDYSSDIETETVNLAEQAGGNSILTTLALMLQTPDLCSRRWIWSQYDHTVMGDTIITPGGDAALVRIHGSDKALAITTDVTPRYCLADPFEGGKQAVAETYRNLCTTGAKPLAITNCLNFGNPERPEIMSQFVHAIEGMAEACAALETPVVSGNVSLYNETNGVAIPPTPAIGAVGLLADSTKAMRMDGAKPADALVALGVTRGWLGQSLYLRDLFDITDGAPPPVDLAAEKALGEFAQKIIHETPPHAIHDVSDGGLLVAAAEMALASGQGLALTTPVAERQAAFWFGEDQARMLVALAPEAADDLILKASMAGIQASRLGVFGGDQLILDGDDRLWLIDLAEMHEATLPLIANRQTQENSPMAMEADVIKQMILDALPDADVEIIDLAGDNNHFQARISSAAFAGKTRIAQHQMVYKALKGKMGGELHALALETIAK